MSIPCTNVSLQHVTPKPHQLRVANYINRKTVADIPSALVVAHSVGSGKTITALLSAVCFLKNSKQVSRQVIILTPASVLSQFTGEVTRLVPEEYQSRIHCYSHTWWIQRFKQQLVKEQADEEEAIAKGNTKANAKGNVAVTFGVSKPKIVDTARTKRVRTTTPKVVVKEPEDEDVEDTDEDTEEDTEATRQEAEAEAERTLRGVRFVGPEHCMLIVDEAHAFRTHTTWKMGWNVARLLNEAASRASKVLLLTATPIVNSEKDVRNYMAMLNRKTLEDEYRYATKKKLQNPEFLKHYVECGFSFFRSDNTEDYPSVKEHLVKIPMTEAYERMYDMVQENRIHEEPSLVETFTTNPIPFLNGLRKAVNYTTMESPKIQWVLAKVQQDIAQGKKILIYSALKDFGVNRIKDGLDRLGIPGHVITGTIRKDQRSAMVSEFNAGQIRVLLITGAGAEGLDLKETRTLIILEPYWNNARLDQVKGRAVRFRSHARLPPAERTVDIYTLVLTKRATAVWGFKGMTARLGTLVNNLVDVSSSETKMKHRLTLATADEILWKLSQVKTEAILAVTQQVINGSIEKTGKCWLRQTMPNRG